LKALKTLTSVFQVLALFTLAFGQTTTPAPGPGPDAPATQQLTGIVSDSVCKGRHDRKAVTPFGCTLKCVQDGADYVLVVDNTVYILEGDRAELDKFARGRATVKGHVTDHRMVVESVSKVQKKTKARNHGDT
jgi:hypothetical protein